MLEILF